MSEEKNIESEMIFISDVKGKKSVFFGKIAEMMESLFFKNDDWLKSVNLKKQVFNIDNKRVLFMEVESENY